jgi:hypothetical protein
MGELNPDFAVECLCVKKYFKYRHWLDFLTLPYFTMLPSKKSAQTPVFIAFNDEISPGKSWFKLKNTLPDSH